MSDILIPANVNIDAIAADATVAEETVIMLRELLIKFPNLRVYKPAKDNGNCYPCSSTINDIVDDVMIYESRAIGSDTTYIYAWPHTTIGAHVVYSDPPFFIVGKTNTAGFGIVPSPTLEEDLSKADISFKVVRKIRAHLNSKPAIYYM